MTVWPGLNLCYKPLDLNFLTTDLPYFNSLGIKKLRCRNATDAVALVNAGFEVTTGTSAGSSLTAATAQAYHDKVLTVAGQFNALGINDHLDFSIGNENESFINGTDLTVHQLHDLLRQIAADVKASYSFKSVSYSCYNKYFLGGTQDTYGEFLDYGIGALDYIGIHHYGNVSPSGHLLESGNFYDIEKMAKRFGPQVQIDEFGLDAAYDHTSAITDPMGYNFMEHIYRQLIMRLGAVHGATAFLYLYRGSGSGGAGGDVWFQVAKNDFTTTEMQWAQLTKNNYSQRALA